MHTFFRSLPGMGLGLLALPFVALGALQRLPAALLRRFQGEGAGFKAEFLEANLVIDSFTDPANEAAQDALHDRVTALLDKEDWVGMAAFLEELDQTRARLPNGITSLSVALNKLRWLVSDFYENPLFCNDEIAFSVNASVLEAVTEAHRANPENYALAALLGRLHLDCGWAARGSDWAHRVDEEGWAALNSHYAQARALVTRFDPIAYNSPFLAEVQLLMNIGLSEGYDRFQSAVEDWVELDPTDRRIYRLAAFYSLERWFGGDEEAVEMAALCAELSKDTLSDGAYFLVAAHAMHHDEEVTRYVDVDRFVASFRTILRASASNSFAQTRLLAALDDALTPHSPFSLVFDDPDGRVMLLLRKRTGEVLRENVPQLDHTAIRGRMAQLRAILSYGFEEELRRGARVSLSGGTVEITEPPEIATA
ncbi:hypothetical protein C8N43_2829 [Litoreibacter ponti]|uniref:DUF4034 domain-containing protein n=1 Tax=Litoreibacter ponti TaxID=1510457 RepID=A0A2T6BDA3_9RHOB|nr:hypothetical protein [Litoreibacter ponti]PTX54024.1 hypothetical protein C8N43_2829 [Litoreibacter ponti]